MEINIIDDQTEEQALELTGLKHITVAAFRNGKYIFVKRRNSATLELIEAEYVPGEKPRDIVLRLLSDKLGALNAELGFVAAYSCDNGGNDEHGLLYCADISELGPFPHSELVSVYYLDIPPEDTDKWSFPETQIPLFERAVQFWEK
ncbi:MAG: hypothetical protein ACI4WS_09320 [Oscillospiraceae bacterium]